MIASSLPDDNHVDDDDDDGAKIRHRIIKFMQQVVAQVLLSLHSNHRRRQ